MKQQQTIAATHKINGLVLLANDALIYTCNRELLYRDAESKITTCLLQLPDTVAAGLELEIKVSEEERFVVVYAVRGCAGFVFDRLLGSVTLQLQRGDYHVKHCAFPIALFEQNGNQYLVHATDWNVIHITNLETLQRITERKQVPYDAVSPEDKSRYLDYFHSLLHISPGKQWIISNGWVWGPAAILRIWNLQNWLLRNPYEVEDRERTTKYIGGYSWNRPLCWINEDEFLFYFHSGEDDDQKEEGMEVQQAYLLVFNVRLLKHTRFIPFDGFQCNEYWECLDGAALFYNEGNVISSCPEKGVSVIDLDSGFVRHRFPGRILYQFQSQSKTLVTLSGNEITLYQLPGTEPIK